MLTSIYSLGACNLPNTTQTGNSGDNHVNVNLYIDGKLLADFLKKQLPSPSPATPTPALTSTPWQSSPPAASPRPRPTVVPTPTAPVTPTPLPTPIAPPTPIPFQVLTLAGSGQSGFVDGSGSSARFENPYGIAIDASGNLYVSDTHNHVIRKITSAGFVTTLAGNGQKGSVDGSGTTARFEYPRGLTVDTSGNLYVTDWGNHAIRKITPMGVVTTVAGGSKGLQDGNGASAKFNHPSDITVDVTGVFYIADEDNDRIRQLTVAGQVTTLAGSQTGFADGAGILAKFKKPFGIVSDAAGHLYVSDRGNHRIRKLVKQGNEWIVSTLSGTGQAGLSDGSGSSATFRQPAGLVMDNNGAILVADEDNHRIRLISPTGQVTTLAGQGSSGYLDGDALQARFDHPMDVTLGSNGLVYVVDRDNNRIRTIVR